MISLETKYLGLTLKNPIIISSSGLTDSVEKIKRLEKAGAGAVVLKSLFEEQIKAEAGDMISSNIDNYPDAADYINSYIKDNSLDQYLTLIEEAKKQTQIPIIASINCYSPEEWTNFAAKIESAGADALELNVFYLPTDKDFTSADYEKVYFDITVKIKNKIKIPFAIKLNPHFTNLTYIIDQVFYRGASGVVLFNRFYEPDIDITTKKFKAAHVLSSPADLRNTLRWIAITTAQIENIDIAASTGAHSGESVIKLLLAGAKAVQMCSAVYSKGPEVISSALKELSDWMSQNKYTSIEDFRGSLNYKHIPDPSIYERSQFMKYFSSYH
ncbi:MAG TPA: dihydroorotate dehydrogenase-like protein [Bacteroidales bacterium]|nr:dihydroorotate dehydrogenase-like protein [Bacteroidales bacterium]